MTVQDIGSCSPGFHDLHFVLLYLYSCSILPFAPMCDNSSFTCQEIEISINPVFFTTSQQWCFLPTLVTLSVISSGGSSEPRGEESLIQVVTVSAHECILFFTFENLKKKS